MHDGHIVGDGKTKTKHGFYYLISAIVQFFVVLVLFYFMFHCMLHCPSVL